MAWLIFLLGVMTGFTAKYLWEIKTSQKIKFTWWQYLSMAVWVLWVGFGLIFVVVSAGEYEPKAASLGALIFGGVAILALVAFRIMYLRQKQISVIGKNEVAKQI